MTITTTPALETALAQIQPKLTPEALEQISGVYAFHFKDLGETHTLDAHSRDGRGWVRSEPAANQLSPNYEVTISSADFAHLVAGTLHPMAGMATGRMKLKGSIKEALKLDRLLKA